MVSELQPLIGQLRSKRLSFLLTVGKGFPDIAPQLEYFSRAFDRDQAKSEQVPVDQPGLWLCSVLSASRLSLSLSYVCVCVPAAPDPASRCR
jgi:hypothetical protein